MAGKRRKGKQGGRFTPLGSTTAAARQQSSNTTTSVSAASAPTAATSSAAAATATSTKSSSQHNNNGNSNNDLILTSEKRRGAYECDYCHVDISQLPRIRCAVCPDFDLCLDCFATTDHSVALARLKAAASAHDAVAVLQAQSNANAASASGANASAAAAVSSGGGTAVPPATTPSGVSMAAIHHDDTHGYRVCDNTRFPVFPSTRTVFSSSSKLARGSTTGAAAAVVARKQPNEEEPSSSDPNTPRDGSSSTTAATAMDVDDVPEVEATEAGVEGAASTKAAAGTTDNDEKDSADSKLVVLPEELLQDPKSIWTVEEDLRLLEGIRTHGLGNWVEISEVVGGLGSVGKTPKRCMERYFDDWMGRYGHIFPPFTLIPQEMDDDSENSKNNNDDKDEGGGGGRASKRQRTAAANAALLPRTTSGVSTASSNATAAAAAASNNGAAGARMHQKCTVQRTESIAGGCCDGLWPEPYLPPVQGVTMGQEVGREDAFKAEHAYVRMISALESKEEVDQLHKSWKETRLNKPSGPTVLPPRTEDILQMPGAELAGFMPRRGDFDMEWENNAEQAVADMEFHPGEPAADVQLKLAVLAIYNAKLDEREKRKQFVLSRKLYDYRTQQLQAEQSQASLPRDERDLIHRMRLFARFHTPEEHQRFISDLLKAKRLRKEIAKLQMYRRMGITSLAEAEKYELDKSRRHFHKTAQTQKIDANTDHHPAASAASAGASGRSSSDAATTSSTTGAAGAAAGTASDHAAGEETVSSSLWHQYRTTDRKIRKSINRGSSSIVEDSSNNAEKNASGATTDADATATTSKQQQSAGEETAPTPHSSETTAAASNDAEEGDNTMENKAKSTIGGETTTANNEDNKMEAGTKEASSSSSSPNEEEEEQKQREEEEEQDMTRLPGYGLLSPKEVELCERLRLRPGQYLEIKRALIHESLLRGLLDNEGPGSSRRTIVKMDVERRGNVVDFMIRAGWISAKLGATARSLPATAPATTTTTTTTGSSSSK